MSPLLSNAITITLVAYGLAMLLALWRMLRGPAAQDRVLALDALTMAATMLLLVFGIGSGTLHYFHAALLLALFSFVGSMAMAKFLLRGEVIE